MKPRKSKSLLLAAFAAAFACLVPAGLVSSSANGAVTSGGGGLLVPEIPEISDVICLTGCTAMREASIDSKVQVSGTEMSGAKWIAFRGAQKNIRVEVDEATTSRVIATVPEGAVSGRVRLITAGGSASDPSTQSLTVGDKTFTRTGRLTITDASTSPTKAYQYGARRPVLDFVINGSTPKVDLRVDVVNSAGDVVRSRFLNQVPTGSTQKVGWNGLSNGGKWAPNGGYRFVVRGNDGTAASVSTRLKRAMRKAKSSRTAADPFSFRMYAYIFPLRAPHTYGDGIGAGRGHQGQDVLAKCGEPLVAARAGTVYYNDYQAEGAGNYLVINIKGGGGKSHVYMHMPVRSPLKVGTQVKTGQRIGSVGTTGRSSACHLHFEVWSAPGWYQGGTFMDPTPFLKAWDRYS